MKIKIDKAGNLWLGRGPAEKMKPQWCAHDPNANCGDSCPMFHAVLTATGAVTLNLCHTKAYRCRLDEFTDARE